MKLAPDSTMKINFAKKGHFSRAWGLNVKCPGHGGCTATLKYTYSDNVSDEQHGGRKLAKMVTESQEPIYIEKVTTDSDGRMASGFGEERKTQRGTKTDSFLDTARGCHLYTIACCHH